jgi:hypothetical protein
LEGKAAEVQKDKEMLQLLYDEFDILEGDNNTAELHWRRLRRRSFDCEQEI